MRPLERELLKIEARGTLPPQYGPGVIDEDGYFGESVAAGYDESTAEMFAVHTLDPVVELLAELAGSGRALDAVTQETRADATQYNALVEGATRQRGGHTDPKLEAIFVGPTSSSFCDAASIVAASGRFTSAGF